MLAIYNYLYKKIKYAFAIGLVVTLWSTTSLAQTDLKIGNLPGTITTSAVFEAASTTKGMLIPRMTTAQMNAISSPANGLMIYNTTDSCVYIRRVSSWISTCSPTFAMSWGLLGNSGTTVGTNFLGTTDAQGLAFRTNNTEWMRMSTTGSIGLGLTSPSVRLHQDGGTATATYHKFTANTTTGQLSTDGFDVGIDATGNAVLKQNEALPMLFSTNATEQMRITSAGNVGIGITAPNTKFDVVSSALTTTPTMNVTSTAAGVNENYGTNYRNFSGAYFGYIGTPPAGSGGGQGAAIIAGNNKSITFYTGASVGSPGTAWDPTSTENVPRMTILQYTGYTGIGTMTPLYKLDIDANTGGTGNPLRLQGLQAGSTADSIVSSSSGILRRLSIAQVIGNSWNITGNASTVDGTNFIGSTDNIPLTIRVNNQKSGRIGIVGETYLGYQSGNAVTSGLNNTFIGYQAGVVTTNSWGNTGLGYRALYLNTTGGSNVAIGDSALSVNSTGGNNAALGYRAGLTSATGSNNTFLGATSDVSSAALTNATAVGYGASVTASNKIRLGNSSVTLVETSGSFVTVSDRRLKTNIEDNYIGLNFINAMRPVKYELKAQKGIVYDGFIAQEIDSILLKQNIKTFSGLARPAGTEGYYTVSYATFVVPLVNAVKELDAKSEAAKKENADLRAELEKMKAENAALKAATDKNSRDIENIKALLEKKN